MFRSKKTAGLTILIFVGCSKISSAADWKIDGTLGQKLQYNDNILLSPGKTSAFGYILTPGLQIQRKSQVLDLSLLGQGDIRIYDDSRWNCENYNFALLSNYRSDSGRSIFKLDGGYNRTCALVQQLTDTGLLIPKSQGEGYHVAPSWTWRWTPIDQVNINPSYSRQSYTSPQIPGSITPLHGNETFGFSIGETHAWSPRLLLKGGIFFSNTQFIGAQKSNRNSFSFSLGGAYKISERWSVSAEGGPQWVDSNASGSSASDKRDSSVILGGMGKVELTYRGQIDEFSLNISSSAMPSAFGQLQQYTSVRGGYKHKFTKHLLLDVGGEFLHSKSIGAGIDRNYVSASMGLLWEPIKHWALKGEYDYRWQEYNQNNRVRAYSNVLMLSLNYEF